MLDNNVLGTIHDKIFQKNADCNEVTKLMHDISIQYNIDKKTIILDYFNMIICCKKLALTSEFLITVEQIVHNNQLQSFEMLKYFYYNMRKFA